MSATTERIEVGLDHHGERVTIVVGNESNSILAVQSVVVLPANFKKKPWNLCERKSMFRRRSNSNLSNCSPAPPPRPRNGRSELLRPNSPKAERRSSRRGERDQPPKSRGRDFSRSDRSVSSRSSRHGHRGSSRRRPSTSGCSVSSSRQGVVHSNSSSDCTDLAPTEETNTPKKKNVSGRRRIISYRPHFRNQRVDPVLMVADV